MLLDPSVNECHKCGYKLRGPQTGAPSGRGTGDTWLATTGSAAAWEGHRAPSSATAPIRVQLAQGLCRQSVPASFAAVASAFASAARAAAAVAQRIAAYRVEYSQDGTNWVQVYETSTPDEQASGTTKHAFWNGVSAHYWRFLATSHQCAKVDFVEWHGFASHLDPPPFSPPVPPLSPAPLLPPLLPPPSAPPTPVSPPSAPPPILHEHRISMLATPDGWLSEG